MTKAKVGVIGGSGVYNLQGFVASREERIETPWGEPSDALRFGRVRDTEVVFLARHGRGHRFTPSSINYRANIDALKRAGATDVISVSAGVRGTQILLAPSNYLAAVKGVVGPIGRSKL